MKRWYRSRRLWLAVMVVMIPLGAVLYLRNSTVNVMHPALDKLAALPFGQRWSAPEMLKIRELGDKAMPPLRRVLREKDSPLIRFLLWVKAKWPGATKYYSHFPDPKKLSERRWAASQVIQTLGPAGKSAAPELIQILNSKDMSDLNAATMALYRIGIDADICEQLDTLIEKGGVPDVARASIVRALAEVKPPSARTLKVLAAALADTSFPYSQQQAAQAFGRLEVNTPETIAGLKQFLSASTNPLSQSAALAALWNLEHDTGMVFPKFVKLVENQTANYNLTWGNGNGGQGVDTRDLIVMEAGDIFQKMKLEDRDRSKVLSLLEAYGDKTERIFIRMLLLPRMIQLGYPEDKCLDVCRNGLRCEEDYYRIQAAQLLSNMAEKYSMEKFDLDALLQDKEVGVRVYAAKLHWLKKHDAKAVVSVLIDSLDRTKHQSYYYAQALPAALKVLAEIGPEAHEAKEALEKVLRDPNPEIVKLANEALGKIRK